MYQLCSYTLSCGYFRENRMLLDNTIELISILVILQKPLRAGSLWESENLAVQQFKFFADPIRARMGPAVTYLQQSALKRRCNKFTKISKEIKQWCTFFIAAFWNHVSKHRAIIIDCLLVQQIALLIWRGNNLR